MQEVIIRRFDHPEWNSPDFILIDGGKPQVDAVYKVMQHLHINIPMAGVSKYSGDKLIFPKGTGKSTRELAKSIKNILLSIRDEAHRFGLKVSRRKRKIK